MTIPRLNLREREVLDAVHQLGRASADDIRAAGNPGQATGAAMKHLKPQGLEVEGKDVAAAVAQIRG